MKPASLKIRQAMMATLADGHFHSGEEFAAEFGISRTAVAGHIRQLTTWGLDVFKVKGKGYKLNQPMVLLNAEKIQTIIGSALVADIEVAPVLESTNTELKRRCLNNVPGETLLAEIQTGGRGRHGRAWLAPVGSSLTLSMYWRFEDGYQGMAGLSLLVGIAICRALKKFDIDDARLKWPNDVYLRGRKLAGVLIEVEGQIGASAHSIIGIGLNVRLPDGMDDVGQPCSDLSEYLRDDIDRNHIAAEIIRTLWSIIPEFQNQGFAPFVDEWCALDWFADRTVVMQMGDKRISGIDRGIDASGALLVETQDGITRFHGGEVSLRAT